MPNWKLIILGGLAFYVVTFIISFATGPLIHEGYLKPEYQAHAALWRPELNQDPPDMAALMPRWVTTGVISSLLLAAIYGWVGKVFTGPGWLRGVKAGLLLGVIGITFCLGYSGIFNASDKIWTVWALEGFLYYLPGGAVLGWLGAKWLGGPGSTSTS